MPPPDASTLLFAVVGDIHGRFLRLERWLEALEQARGRQVNFVLAVGDVEAFESADDH
ncbi:MAG TPA: metallophosphoesterase family protein, partial [Myxococcaceae bacterium]|nr:metallophosphoesterase family protein [Myxococcaceae bacterium]